MIYDSEYIVSRLFELRDLKYRDFHAALMPTVPKDKIIGVRVPQLRKLAAEIIKQGDYQGFLSELPHRYYEQDNLHALLIASNKNFDETIKLLEIFLPYIDYWATCDMISPKAFSGCPELLCHYAEKWAMSEHVYTARFGISVFMKCFLGINFEKRFADIVAAVNNDDYYVKMMQAWYFATALAKNESDILLYIENRKLSPWVHNKAIQKSVESLRISDDLKCRLRKMRIK